MSELKQVLRRVRSVVGPEGIKDTRANSSSIVLTLREDLDVRKFSRLQAIERLSIMGSRPITLIYYPSEVAQRKMLLRELSEAVGKANGRIGGMATK